MLPGLCARGGDSVVARWLCCPAAQQVCPHGALVAGEGEGELGQHRDQSARGHGADPSIEGDGGQFLRPWGHQLLLEHPSFATPHFLVGNRGEQAG